MTVWLLFWLLTLPQGYVLLTVVSVHWKMSPVSYTPLGQLFFDCPSQSDVYVLIVLSILHYLCLNSLSELLSSCPPFQPPPVLPTVSQTVQVYEDLCLNVLPPVIMICSFTFFRFLLDHSDERGFLLTTFSKIAPFISFSITFSCLNFLCCTYQRPDIYVFCWLIYLFFY